MLRQGPHPRVRHLGEAPQLTFLRPGKRPARVCTLASVTLEKHIRFTVSRPRQRSARAYTPASVTLKQRHSSPT